MREYIKGKYLKSIFSSDKGYVIGIMKVLDTNIDDAYDFIDKTLTFTGYFPELKEEENYLFYGELVDHVKYGIQFQVSSSELILPDTKDGLVLFLSSDLFKGIGEKLAEEIVKTLGEDAIEKILTDPSVLNLVPKLTAKKAATLVNTLNEYSHSHRTIVSLTEKGFTMREALLIYNYYRDKTEYMIENYFYRITDDIEEITFLKLDSLRSNLNILDDFKDRLVACTYYALKELLFKTGDTYTDIESLKKEVEFYLDKNIDDNLFKEYIDELVYENKLVINHDRISTKKIYDAEEFIASKIYHLSILEENKIKDIDKKLEELEQEENVSYNDEQKEAIISSLKNNITIITGGPGTGKTTIIKAIVKLYSKIYNKKDAELIADLALLAPTGRAAKRMAESACLPASTIHRFLKWDKDSNLFQVDEYSPDFSKLIIVDEVSMIDTELFSSLLKGLTNNIRLILVGDVNQLPSVAPGNVLKDLIDSDISNVIYLDLLYRQSEDSYIPVLAEEIKNNELGDFTKQKDDYLFIECPKEGILGAIKKLTNDLMEKGYDDKKLTLLAPMYAGINGIDNLNKELQNIFNPKKNQEEIKVGDITYRENDKILELVNMPDENVFNGDVGYIERIIPASVSTSHKNEIYVNFDGNLVRYLPKDFNKIKHGFIISIHKSQGSEFDLVLMPICMSYYRMLYKKLIYTGITRAKRKLIIVGEAKAFMYASSNTAERLRKTLLCEKLISKYNS